jgi:hypothetical protein
MPRGASLRQYIGAEIPFFFLLITFLYHFISNSVFPQLSTSLPLSISISLPIFPYIIPQRTAGEAHRTILRALPIGNEVAYRFCSTERNRKYAFNMQIQKKKGVLHQSETNTK